MYTCRLGIYTTIILQKNIDTILLCGTVANHLYIILFVNFICGQIDPCNVHKNYSESKIYKDLLLIFERNRT